MSLISPLIIDLENLESLGNKLHNTKGGQEMCMIFSAVLTFCMTLDKSFTLAVPQLPCLQMGKLGIPLLLLQGYNEGKIE